jgi:glycosyltransferase involved in cell wall biosynthesis
MSAPSLSVIVNFFNSRREAARTLRSLSAAYQNQADRGEYEVIAIDNGSSAPLSDELVRGHGPNIRYVFHVTTSKSPVEAINRAVAGCTGRHVMILIDGAHMLSPGVIRNVHTAFRSFASPFVATVPFHLGPEVQNISIMKGYTEEVEDKLLSSIDWASNGYRLFEVAGACSDASMGWFGRLYESGCFAISKAKFLQLGGFDERFQARGGGLANLDFFARAAAQTGSRIRAAAW